MILTASSRSLSFAPWASVMCNKRLCSLTSSHHQEPPARKLFCHCLNWHVHAVNQYRVCADICSFATRSGSEQLCPADPATSKGTCPFILAGDPCQPTGKLVLSACACQYQQLSSVPLRSDCVASCPLIVWGFQCLVHEQMVNISP